MARPDPKRRPAPKRASRAAFGGFLLALAGTLLRLKRTGKIPSKAEAQKAGRSAPHWPPAKPGAAPPKPAAVEKTSQTPGYEVRDTKVSTLVAIMLVGVCVIGGSIAGLFVMIGHFRAADARHAPLTAQQQAVIVPPGPPLQSHPLVDIAAERKREDDLLHSYAWIDAGRTRVRIPIERAAAIVIGKPLDPTP